ncbi:uncharacterized protein LOC131224322 [Magnolia sinica]|uniref:uncharacterized protein LOC131224322 n=1 Tax=Magnolia sinica TaxID=86752 RepID=UPI00265AEC8C|nr:uncharacterized protein LOC131224322 [Magnolia sinica]
MKEKENRKTTKKVTVITLRSGKKITSPMKQKAWIIRKEVVERQSDDDEKEKKKMEHEEYNEQENYLSVVSFSDDDLICDAEHNRPLMGLRRVTREHLAPPLEAPALPPAPPILPPEISAPLPKDDVPPPDAGADPTVPYECLAVTADVVGCDCCASGAGTVVSPRPSGVLTESTTTAFTAATESTVAAPTAAATLSAATSAAETPVAAETAVQAALDATAASGTLEGIDTSPSSSG